MCWLRVADDCFSASNFASSWNFGSSHSGELAALQVDVRKFQARKPGWTRATDDMVQTRAHLEALVASALSLRSPSEYRQCLMSYIHFLTRRSSLIPLCNAPDSTTVPTVQTPVFSACLCPHSHVYEKLIKREADECRLREFCERFLGPPIGMIESGSPDLITPEWDSSMLGMK